MPHWNMTRNADYYSVRCQSLKIDGQLCRIITLQNIRSEMERQEIEAWQKLIRIMAHEIMNSVTPITSLSETAAEMLMEADGNAKTSVSLSQHDLDRILKSLLTIEERSAGLHDFVDQYRRLAAHLPKPELALITGNQITGMAINLMQADCDKLGIQLEHSLKNGKIQFYGDANLLNHVMINLMRNSIEALQGIQGSRIWIADIVAGDS